MCYCGCDEFIEIKREHYKDGIPKFIRGHNSRPVDPEIVAEMEPPNLWDTLSEEEKQRRIAQLKTFEKGDKNPAWKGGRRVEEHGYILLLNPEHPFAKDGYVFEHRLVVEERTRRNDLSNPLLVEVDGEKYLSPKAVVHHIDEVKGNNVSSNLMLLPNANAHAFIHNSPLPIEERLRRIAAGVSHSGGLAEGEGEVVLYPWILEYLSKEEQLKDDDK